MLHPKGFGTARSPEPRTPVELIYTVTDLNQTFSRTELERARGIRREDKIMAIEASSDGSEIVGRVRGSYGETYKQKIRSSFKGGLTVNGQCSCPVGHNCKHVAALMLEVVTRHGTPAQVKLLAGSTAKTEEISGIPSQPQTVEEMLEYLQRTLSKETLSGMSTATLRDVAKSALKMRQNAAASEPMSGPTPAQPVKRRVETPAVPAITPELQRWLETTERELHPTKPVSKSSKVRELLFVLKAPTVARSATSIELYNGLSKANGTWTDVKHSSIPDHLANVPQYAQQDLDVLQLLMACSGKDYSQSGSNTRNLNDSNLTLEMLSRLLATGRVFLGSLETPALSLGKPRPAQAAWMIDETGTQRARLECEPPANATLPFTHAWYVDTVRHQIGPCETNLEPTATKSFLSAPPVSPESLLAFRHEFMGRFPELPAPKALDLREHTLPCVPCLRLHSGTMPSASWNRPDEPLETLTLEFGYGVRRIASGSAAVKITEYRDGAIHVTTRDTKAERRFELKLLEMNLTPLDGLMPAHRIPANRKNHWSIGKRGGGKLGDREAWLAFINDGLPELQSQGWQVEYEPGFRFNIAQIEDWYGGLGEDIGGWFGLELGVIVDGRNVSLIPILIALIEQNPSLLSSANIGTLSDDHVFYPQLPDGRLLALPAARVRPILQVLIELYGTDRLHDGKLRLPILDAARLLELEESLKLRWFGGETVLELGRKLRDFSGIAVLEPPEGLEANMRPYQIQGVSWLQFLRQMDLGGILADDMGLGKTLQTLAHLLEEKNTGRADLPSLVIAPTSLMTNWRLETEKFTPGLKVLVLHGTERHQDFSRIPEYDLVLTTYPLVLRDLEQLERHQFHLLVLDEAQSIKNARSGAAQAVGSLKARHRLCLTGTPLENHLGELWSLFHFLMPGFLGDEKRFREQYRNPIEKHGDNLRRNALAKRVKPFMLRREKTLVAKELPPKTEIIERVELEGSQRDLYETLRTSMSDRVREEIERSGLARSQIFILDALLKLRQTCLDPRLLKLEAAKKVKHSAKLEWFRESVPRMLEEGRKLLVFSAFSSMLELLEPELSSRDIAYSKLTGDTKNRPEQIDAFQSGKTSVFLISLKAGGVGLNLTAADTVIHLDPWWNPAAEDQASSRAHRIGQTKAVFVYKLIAAGSLEERILQLQSRKAELAKGILEGSLTSSTALTQNDLDQLLAPLG